MITFSNEDFERYAKAIFLTDSPTGYTHNVISLIECFVRELGYDCRIHNKGTLELVIPGRDASKTVASSAHVDTLGLMVRSINEDGTLALTKLGGPITPTLDGEYCRIATRSGKIYSGTILSTSPAIHVFPDASTKSRDIDNLMVRIDEEVKTAEDTQKLEISAGDFVFIDPKFEITPSGFLKTRFIDDKASAVIILMLLKYCRENGVSFRHTTKLYFSVFEEVGHGASAVAGDIDEFVTVDMGCVGLDLTGNEYAVSVCAKDSHGPYDYRLTSRLIELAKENGIDYTVDIFPFYGSDVGAAWSAGRDCAGALIGTGVSASHGMERTHKKGIENTLKLLYAYLCV